MLTVSVSQPFRLWNVCKAKHLHCLFPKDTSPYNDCVDWYLSETCLSPKCDPKFPWMIEWKKNTQRYVEIFEFVFLYMNSPDVICKGVLGDWWLVGMIVLPYGIVNITVSSPESLKGCHRSEGLLRSSCVFTFPDRHWSSSLFFALYAHVLVDKILKGHWFLSNHH